MHINVFKFGGASVNSAAGVRNVAAIVKQFSTSPLLIVVSAMGKTTNALEGLLHDYMNNDSLAVVDSFQKIRESHFSILRDLFDDGEHPVYGEVDSLFNQLRGYIRRGHLYKGQHHEYDFEYDQVVSFGELISASILHHYLVASGCNAKLFNVRDLVKTDSLYRDARVDWNTTEGLIQNSIQGYFSNNAGSSPVAVTQGFIGSDPRGHTTTLGREGSDYSAAIFAWCLHADEMTIWKDVPGVMNADPKWMPESVCLELLSYRETIELAYYGASVIHPKTIKPLENANIVLRVRSFADLTLPGTLVKRLRKWEIHTPIFIRKQNQMLISVSPRDFSFILEENLSEIFRILADFRIKVNVMQNSAISFTICVDADPLKIEPLIDCLNKDYETRYNAGVELFTIRHYTPEAVDRVVQNRKIIMELRSRNTLQVVLK
ncbi:MAG: aspartate kinase [Bacteroidales bacterium]